MLVSAFREGAAHHELCRRWLADAMSNGARVGVSQLVLSGVLRILTHPRVFHPPTPDAATIDFVDTALAQPATAALRPGDGRWRIFRGMVAILRLTGNRLPDAYHAALTIEHGCEWVTLDRGFAVFPGLRARNLLDG